MGAPTRQGSAPAGRPQSDTLPGASIEIQGTSAAVPELSKAEADSLTAEIKALTGTLWQKLKQAHDGRAWKAMGYKSWAEYLSVEFDISRSRGYQLIAHANAVAELADAAGVKVSTNVDTLTEGETRNLDDVAAVAEEVRHQVADLPEEATGEDLAAVLRSTVAEHQKPRLRPVPGPPATAKRRPGQGRAAVPHNIMAKYQKQRPSLVPDIPATAKPRRSPLPDQANRAGWEFRKSVERLERIAGDDRFPGHREQVAAVLRGHLVYAAEVLADLLASLDDKAVDR